MKAPICSGFQVFLFKPACFSFLSLSSCVTLPQLCNMLGFFSCVVGKFHNDVGWGFLFACIFFFFFDLLVIAGPFQSVNFRKFGKFPSIF